MIANEQKQIAGLRKSIAETEQTMETVKETISQLDACLKNVKWFQSRRKLAYSQNSTSEEPSFK